MRKPHPILLPLLLLTLLCTCVRAQTSEIVFPTGVEQYENFAALYLSPQGRGFAVGECGSLLRTTNDGGSFEALPAPNRVSQYTSVACLPGTNCATALLSTNRGTYRSTDFGESWTRVGNRSYSRYNFAINGSIFSFRRGNSVLLLSNDGGASWTELGLPADIVSDIFPLSATEWFFFGDDKCYRTTNAGGSWSPVATLPKAIVSAYRDAAGNFYVALSGNDYYKSTDNGVSWTLKTENGHQYSVHYDLYKDAQDSLHTISFNGVRFSSADDGATWTQVRTLPFQRYNSVHRFEGRLFAAGDALTLLAANADAANVRRLLTDAAPAFDNIQFADGQSGYAFESDNGNLYKSEDGGLSWTLKNNIGGTTEGRMKVTNNKHVYANGGPEFNRTLVRSEDGGSTFLEPRFVRQAGISSQRVVFSPLPAGGLIVLASNGTTIVTDGNAINAEYSHDIDINGGSWDLTMITDQLGFVHRTPREPMYRTANGGQSWQEVAPLGSGAFYTSFFFLNENKGYLCGAGRNTFVTTDGGLSWERDQNIRDTYGIFRVDNSLFAVGSSQLYRSVDEGEFWDPVDDLGCSPITNAAINPETEDIFATYNGAIARFDPREILSPVAEISPLNGSLRAVPNPSAGHFQLSLPSNEVQFTDISVFDITGRQLLHQPLAGNAPPEVDLSQRQPGVYLARLRTSGGRILTTRLVKR